MKPTHAYLLQSTICVTTLIASLSHATHNKTPGHLDRNRACSSDGYIRMPPGRGRNMVMLPFSAQRGPLPDSATHC